MKYLQDLRDNVEAVHKRAAEECDQEGSLVLDVAPQIYEGAKKFFIKATVETLDICEDFNPTYVTDICKGKDTLVNRFDCILITEVLEHVYEPQVAIDNLYYYLKEGGVIYGSTPLDLDIHSPFPDLWRFTDQGLRYILKRFDKIEILPLVRDGRSEFPVQYTFRAIKPKSFITNLL